MKLTPKQLKAYLKAPHTCPYCGSDCIESDPVNGDTLEAHVYCNSCNEYWYDCYQLTGIIEEERV
ncbi:hypothetical protein LCGC14_1929580 [marine sediment metagenome]|uniref:Uncharacterized protein n=1 Tax=marine sediment metagenome TaxID=412755 RepID=A0A0F9I2A8_9ZZZZ